MGQKGDVHRDRLSPDVAKARLLASYHKYGTSDKGRACRKRWRLKVKREAIVAYGGKCFCCGETREEFLTIDHINGGGNHHRKAINGITFWYWLKKHGFPKDEYRLACMNCNFALGKHGYCPHQREREQAPGIPFLVEAA